MLADPETIQIMSSLDELIQKSTFRSLGPRWETLNMLKIFQFCLALLLLNSSLAFSKSWKKWAHECNIAEGEQQITFMKLREKLRKSPEDDLVACEDLYKHRNITELDLSNSSIKDLGPIKLFRNLRTLNLDNNKIVDPSPLRALKTIKNLSLKKNRIIDSTTLMEITFLESLNLSHNSISDLSSFQLKKWWQNPKILKYLNLGYNHITDITPLKSLQHSLKELDLSGNPLIDLSTIRELKKLQRLRLKNLQLENGHLQELLGLALLELVDLTGNDIDDLGALNDLPRLKTLIADQNRVLDFKNLNNIKSVRGITKQRVKYDFDLFNIPFDPKKNDYKQCMICCEDFEEAEELYVVPDCKHPYHQECLATWLKEKHNCPNCQGEIHYEGFPLEEEQEFHCIEVYKNQHY